MDALTRRVKVKDVVFFSALALISIALHAILLFGFNINFLPPEKRLVGRTIRVGFIKRTQSKPTQAPRIRPKTREPAKIQSEKSAAPAPVLEEEPEALEQPPEEFSQFLEKLDDLKQTSDAAFEGDSYDILEGGAPAMGVDEGLALGALSEKRGLLDLRVQMVVSSYPSTSIERKYRQVPYPGVPIERKDYQKGWTSVYFEIRTDSKGRVTRLDLIRPRSPDELERIFVEAVQEEIRSWKFRGEPGASSA